MIYVFLSFFLSFCTLAQENTEQLPTDILPPGLIEEPQNNPLDLLDLKDHIKSLEERIERLEKLLDILRGPQTTEPEVKNDHNKEQIFAPKDPVSDFEKIKLLTITKDQNLESAIELFKTTYKDHPLVPKVHFFLADYYYVQKNYEKSIKLIKEGLETYKDSPEEGRAIWILALSLMETGKQTEACVALKKVLSLPEKSLSNDIKQNALQKIRSFNCQ
jgi:TolA-binding protein